MPKKFDPECACCTANRDASVPPGSQRIARMERSALYLDAGQQVVLAANTHISSVDEMHPKERELFEQDVDRARDAVTVVSGAAVVTVTASDSHLLVRLSPALLGEAEDVIGDVREALGYIREPVTDPLLKNWMKKGRCSTGRISSTRMSRMPSAHTWRRNLSRVMPIPKKR